MKSTIFSILMAVSLMFPGLLYPATMIVTDVDREADTVTICTASGLLYEFSGAEDYEEGDLVACIMYTSRTPEVLDDVILMVRYVGWPELYQEQLALH